MVYLAIILAIGWFSLHPPRIPLFLSPGYLGTPQEDVVIQSSDGVNLRAWWVEADGPWVAVICHGYVMNRAELAGTAAWLYKRGISSVLIDFRAHGKSGGKLCTLGWNEADDVLAAVRFARERKPGCKVMAIGSSMGAAASALAAGREPGSLDALILDGCYSRLSGAISGWWRFLGGKPLAFVLSPVLPVVSLFYPVNPYKVDIASALAAAGPLPVLFIHGEKDDLATADECRRNMAACSGTTDVEWFASAGHAEGRWLDPTRYYGAIERFLERFFSH